MQSLLESPEADRSVDTHMFGLLPIAQVIDQFYGLDLFVHAWDLARASGQNLAMDTDDAGGAYAGMSAMGPALHESGQFGTPQPVPADAPTGDKLLALIGRDPHWAGSRG